MPFPGFDPTQGEMFNLGYPPLGDPSQYGAPIGPMQDPGNDQGMGNPMSMGGPAMLGMAGANMAMNPNTYFQGANNKMESAFGLQRQALQAGQQGSDYPSSPVDKRTAWMLGLANIVGNALDKGAGTGFVQGFLASRAARIEQDHQQSQQKAEEKKQQLLLEAQQEAQRAGMIREQGQRVQQQQIAGQQRAMMMLKEKNDLIGDAMKGAIDTKTFAARVGLLEASGNPLPQPIVDRVMPILKATDEAKARAALGPQINTAADNTRAAFKIVDDAINARQGMPADARIASYSAQAKKQYDAFVTKYGPDAAMTAGLIDPVVLKVGDAIPQTAAGAAASSAGAMKGLADTGIDPTKDPAGYRAALVKQHALDWANKMQQNVAGNPAFKIQEATGKELFVASRKVASATAEYNTAKTQYDRDNKAVAGITHKMGLDEATALRKAANKSKDAMDTAERKMNGAAAERDGIKTYQNSLSPVNPLSSGNKAQVKAMPGAFPKGQQPANDRAASVKVGGKTYTYTQKEFGSQIKQIPMGPGRTKAEADYFKIFGEKYDPKKF